MYFVACANCLPFPVESISVRQAGDQTEIPLDISGRKRELHTVVAQQAEAGGSRQGWEDPTHLLRTWYKGVWACAFAKIQFFV